MEGKKMKRMASGVPVILVENDGYREIEIGSSSRSKRVCITIDDDDDGAGALPKKIGSRVFPDVVLVPDVAEEVPEIECSCCFVDFSFDQIVQCADGHLFCFTCLRRHVEESAFGAKARESIACMDTSGCTAVFPWSQISRAVPAEVLQKYDKRIAEDSVFRARIEGLVYCPFCNVPCEADPELELLQCPNGECSKVSCLKCREPNHAPNPCKEKLTETSLRRRVEELMTKALVRVCKSCNAEVVKSQGCNKVVCRCGKIMCYVCQKQIKDYSHFCQLHNGRGNTGQTCKQCNKCRLTGKEESADAVLKRVKASALQEAATEDPEIVNQKIGPDFEHLKKTKAAPQQKTPRSTRRRQAQ